MPPVTTLVFHQDPAPDAGPLARALADARAALAAQHVRGFRVAGSDDVRVVAGPPDDTTFGRRVRQHLGGLEGRGLILLGSGSLALAGPRDRRAFVAVAASGRARALANNRHSADAVAVGRADLLGDLPHLRSDNVLPRWLAERDRADVEDLGRRWRLAIDLDSPLDVLLVAGAPRPPGWARRAARDLPESAVGERLAAVARVTADPGAELLVAGRTSARTLAWLERRTASRTRAIVEERGLRASQALGSDGGQRPPRSLLGAQLDRIGPEALGSLLATLADAALVDLRVLLAHRLGPDEATWPSPEDRYAADLLQADAIEDRWLRALVRSAADAPIPVVLGGHTLVGPGVRLVVART